MTIDYDYDCAPLYFSSQRSCRSVVYLCVVFMACVVCVCVCVGVNLSNHRLDQDSLGPPFYPFDTIDRWRHWRVGWRDNNLYVVKLGEVLRRGDLFLLLLYIIAIPCRRLVYARHFLYCSPS
jgi:hypothetical protein